ncbi:unnamed protein product, partial [Staurois parvus]
MGPPTDPGPSGSARVPKWSVRLWLRPHTSGELTSSATCSCTYLSLLLYLIYL